MPEKDIQLLTSEMIAIPSLTTDQEACLKVLDYISSYLGKVHAETYLHTGVYSRIWGDNNTLMNPRLLLSGHIDVVDVEGDDTLFHSKEEAGKLYGRGAGDMKGHVASMLYSYKKWLEEGGPRGVGLLLTSDEEIGGFNGTRYVVEQGLKPKVVFIPDGTLDFSIVKSQKAPHHFVVEIQGQGGHAADSYKIKDPIDSLIAFYLRVQEKYDIATPENGWASTFKMTVVNTPNQSKNKIPDRVTAAFSWRWPPEQILFEEGRDEITNLAKQYGVKILEEEGGGEGCILNENAEFVTQWKTIIEEIIGRGVKFVNMHGTTDGRHFYNSKVAGTKNVLVTSAISGDHHQKGEWVDIQSLNQLSGAISRYMRISE